MSPVCPACRYQNMVQARFCAQCGQQLPNAGTSKSPAARLLGEAAQSVDDLLSRPAVRDTTRKAGDVLLQIGDELDRLSQSGEVQRAREQIGEATEKAIQAVRGQVATSTARQPTPDPTSAEVAQAKAPSPPALLRDKPCLRCGTPNRRESRFCSACGARIDLGGTALSYSVAYLSDIGRQRDNNEDTARVWSFAPHGLPAWVLLVADGMGGQAAGEVASQRVAQIVETEIRNRWNSDNPRPAELKKWLRLMILNANRSIYQQARANPAQSGMGTTATLAWLEGDRVSIAHVGDSRAYLIPPTGDFWQISQDHTMVSLLVSLGEMTAEEAASDEQNNLLYRAVGSAEKVEVDTYERRMEPGDRLLLCSDGLTRHVSSKEIAHIVRSDSIPATACRRLVALANERGGEDNISVILALAQASPTG